MATKPNKKAPASTGGSIVQYGGFTLDDADDVDKAVDTIAGKQFLSIGVGDTIVRFLPPLPGKKTLRVSAVHYVDALPGMDKLIVFACPRYERKEPCIACDKADQLRRSQSPIDRDRAWKISAQLKIYAAVIDRDNEEAGPRVYAFGKNVHTQLKAIRRNPRLGGDFTDPTENGFDIIINRTGTGVKDTRYAVAAARENTPLSASPELMQMWIENQPDLDSLVTTETPDELLAAWADLAQAHRGQAARAAGAQSAQGGTATMGRPAAPRPARSAVADSKGVIDAVSGGDDDAWLDE